MNRSAKAFCAVLACLSALVATGCIHAQSSWDQTLQADNRFQLVMGDHGVLDKETDLVWERSPGDTNGDGEVTVEDWQSWNQARLHCATKAVGARKGWRLPSFHELASLVDPAVPVPGPTLAAGHPFEGVQPGVYWSATVDAAVAGRRWVVLLNSGNVAFVPESNSHLVWCVRGGGPITEY